MRLVQSNLDIATELGTVGNGHCTERLILYLVLATNALLSQRTRDTEDQEPFTEPCVNCVHSKGVHCYARSLYREKMIILPAD